MLRLIFPPRALTITAFGLLFFVLACANVAGVFWVAVTALDSFHLGPDFTLVVIIGVVVAVVLAIILGAEAGMRLTFLIYYLLVEYAPQKVAEFLMDLHGKDKIDDVYQQWERVRELRRTRNIEELAKLYWGDRWFSAREILYEAWEQESLLRAIVPLATRCVLEVRWLCGWLFSKMPGRQG